MAFEALTIRIYSRLLDDERESLLKASPFLVERPMNTVPTGDSGVPPVGPAIPVADIAISVPRADLAPLAISMAVCADTAL